MRDLRFGAVFRAVRIRRGWRQADLAARAHVSAGSVSRIERGDIGRMQLDTIEAVGAALEIRVQILARWRGSDIDRLLSARHTAMQERLARLLSNLDGWTVLPEVSFSIRGERGVIDLLAWHAATRSLLVIEVKTQLVDIQELLATHDRKRRLAAEVARQRGWQPRTVSAWLVIADTSTDRRRARAHGTLLRASLPNTPWELRRWLRDPSGSIGALSFLSDGLPENVRQKNGDRRRVRCPSSRVAPERASSVKVPLPRLVPRGPV